MSLSSLKSAGRYSMAVVLLAAMPASLWAQEPAQGSPAPSSQAQSSQGALPQAPAPAAKSFTLTDYSKANRAFPNVIAPYKSRSVPPPDLVNTPRIEQVMRDGKIYLSMDDAVALALENNLDIAIARYNLNIADTDIWRAKSGQATRGVNTGLVQGTPGGTGAGVGTTSTGGGAGGTTVGTGGAGAGTSGLV